MKFMFDSFEDYLSNSPLAGQKGQQVDTMKLIFSLARSSENLSEVEVARLLGISEKDFVLETTYRMAKTPAMGSSTKKTSKTKTSKKTHELVLVSNGDDWEALYLDGKKVCAGHKVSRTEISEYSQKYNTKMVTKYVSDAYNEGYAQNLGDFHDNLSEVELES